MSTANYKKLNQSAEICKLIAACMVIFCHNVTFPGNGEYAMECLARFAVPVFFAISGYYSYNITDKHIVKRALRIFIILIVSTLIYAVLESGLATQNGRTAYDYLRDCLNVPNFAQWIIMNANPFAGHLWYLSGMLTVYLIFWVYTRFRREGDTVDYKPMYTICAAALIIHIALGTKANGADLDFHYKLYRNGLLFGLPMFGMGLFIRENQQRINDRLSLTAPKEIIIIILGMLLSLLERFGLGKAEMPVGTIFEVFAIMMLITSHPVLFKSDGAAKFIYMIKDAPLAIYIIHPAYIDTINTFSGRVAYLGQLKSMEYLYPLIFIGASLVSGIVFSLAKYGITSLAKRNK